MVKSARRSALIAYMWDARTCAFAAFSLLASSRKVPESRGCGYGGVACLVRGGFLLAAAVSVSWLVPARSWVSSSR